MTTFTYRVVRLALLAACALAALTASAASAGAFAQPRGQSSHAQGHSLWKVYDHVLRQSKYIDLTHTITPSIPVWAGFGPSTFMPASDPTTGEPYTYAESGFEATAYMLADRSARHAARPACTLGTRVPAIDELPPTFAVRPLVVISIVPKVERDFNYRSRSRTSVAGRSATVASRREASSWCARTGRSAGPTPRSRR